MINRNRHISWFHLLRMIFIVGFIFDCLVIKTSTGQDSLKPVTNDQAVRVKTARPIPKPEITFSVEQPADVAPYYRAELYPEIAGKVVFLEKDLGDPVRSGEKILEIQPASEKMAGSISREIKAPFDGVIALRSVDPGTFVPSAEIVPVARPLVVIERNDIVTVTMKVPDQYSTYVNQNTVAQIRMDSLPGHVFQCKISRVAPSLATGDRTLTVQVDLYNRSKNEFELLKNRFAKDGGADLKSRRIPEFPEGLGNRQTAGLIPGMYGRMRLIFNSPLDRLFIPGSAIGRSGGIDYIYRIENGVARRLRVKIEFDNIDYASVIIPDKSPSESFLKSNDEIVISNLSELEDGQKVFSSSIKADSSN